MKIVVSGMSPRDETAFDLFLKRLMSGWRWLGEPVKPGEPLPFADVLVIDLAACGWPQYTDAALAQLEVATGQSVAVLLVSANDNTWQSAPAAQKTDKWIWLAKPYNAESMRKALTQATDLVKAQQKRPQTTAPAAVAAKSLLPALKPPLPVMLPTLPAAPVVSASVPDLAVILGHEVVEKPQAVEPDPVQHGLSPEALAARLTSLPVERHVLLRKLSTGLQTHQAFELRFTVHNALIVNPVDGWVASNMPMPVMLRVCSSDALAALVTVREISHDQAEDRLHQLGVIPHELDEFLLELALPTLPDVTQTAIATV